MKHTKISIALALMLVALTGAVYAKTARLTWNPGRLAPESIAPGETMSFAVTLKNNGPDTFETEHLKVSLSGDIASMVSVRNGSFPKKIRKGESVPVTFDVTVSQSSLIGVVRGSAVLMKRDDDHDDDNGHKRGRKDKDPKKVFLSDSLPLEITVSSIKLPPDPGEAGKRDVLGIDSDQNGVRDDIDRYIVLTYPDSEKTRMALSQYAREEQKFLADADDKQKSIENSRLIERAMNCLNYLFKEDVNHSFDASSLLDAEFLNTPERSRAEVRADSHLGGQTGYDSSDEEDKAACDANPDTLSN